MLQRKSSPKKQKHLSPQLQLTFDRALQLQRQGQFGQALSLYQEILKIRPEHFDSLHLLGVAAIQTGNIASGLKLLDKAIEINPQVAAARNSRGNVLTALKKPREALDDFDIAIALSPDYAEAHNNRGVALMALKRFDDALLCFDKATSCKPGYAMAYNNGGNVLQELNRKSEALNYYKKAVTIQPDFKEAQYAISALSNETIPDIAPEQYVTKLFDSFAENFDNQLINNLGYKTPTILAEQLSRYIASTRLDILDLGCGTGLSGAEFSRYAQHMVGVDLSSRMLEKAKQRAIYDRLVQKNIIDYLGEEEEKFDLVICADVLVYIGDLSNLFAGVNRILKSGGWFSLSVESSNIASYELKLSRRYGHSLQYLDSMAASTGFIVKDSQCVDLRKDGEEVISGHVVLMYKC